MRRRAAALALLLGLPGAAYARTPAAIVPPRPSTAVPRIETPVEALAEDAADYAARHAVPFGEALARLQALEASVPLTDALAQEFADRLAGIAIEHAPEFRIVVLLTGPDPVADRSFAGMGLAMPVVFRTDAPATRAQLLDAIARHQADLRAALSAPPGMGVDARTGKLVVMVRRRDLDRDGADALAARLAEIAGVPVEPREWNAADMAMDVAGGGRVTGIDPADGKRYVCTAGFVVTDGTRSAIATAAHCPDDLAYRDPVAGQIPLTFLNGWGARYQDVQIHLGPGPWAPLFFADTAKSELRAVTTWRNRSSARVGDVVCHRGEHSGYSCAEIAFVDYAPPGDLCAGPCMPTWVAVRGPHCHGGDSGGPVFLGTVALGFVKGGSYAADAACRLYYYMSVDYLPPGWTVAVR